MAQDAQGNLRNLAWEAQARVIQIKDIPNPDLKSGGTALPASSAHKIIWGASPFLAAFLHHPCMYPIGHIFEIWSNLDLVHGINPAVTCSGPAL